MSCILIVDDSELDRLFIAALAQRFTGYATLFASDGLEAVNHIHNDVGQKIAAVILDVSMPNLDGRAALPLLLNARPHLQIIAVTSVNDPKSVVEFIKLGAADYLIKPVDPDMFGNALSKAIQLHDMRLIIEQLNHKDEVDIHFNNLIGQSKALQTCIKLGQRAATSDITVLITGESGTGKEMLARAIHAKSARAKEAFVAVNCGAIPKDLVESTLFGHKRGSFTGAFTDAKGKFLEANGGTLFLDEIGELPLDAQVKLLRALQQCEIEPVGAGRTVPVNVRIIAATNRNPYSSVQNGHMREDLFYRLNVFPISMPPLRQRKEDIDILSDFFLHRYALVENKSIKGFDAEAVKWMAAHDWPGNIRELENSIFRAVLLCDGDRIGLEHLLPYTSSNLMPKAEKPNTDQLTINIVNEAGDFKTMDRIIHEIERASISYFRNDISLAAQQLGIGKSTLYRHQQKT